MGLNSSSEEPVAGTRHFRQGQGPPESPNTASPTKGVACKGFTIDIAARAAVISVVDVVILV